MQKFLQKKFLGISYLLLLSLLLISSFAFFLRAYLIPENLFFGPEQGRDLLVVRDMVVNHKLTLIGPKTDIGGVFHGPFFYYLLTIPFIFSSGDPLTASIFLIIMQSSAVIFIYFLGKSLANSRVGYICAILFAISFGAIQYARWLSNPPLSIPCVVIAMLFLSRYLKGREKSLIGYSIFIGLLNQAEFLNIIFYAVFTLGVLIVFFKRFRKSSPIFLGLNLLIMAVISVGSFILFDIRHKFLMSKSVLSLFNNQMGTSMSFVESVQSNFGGFINSYAVTIFPFHEFFGAVIFFISVRALVIYRRDKYEYKLIALWLLMPVLILIFLRHSALEQFFVSLIPAFIILVAIAIDMLWNRSAFLAIALTVFIVGIQLFAWIQNIPLNKNIFFQSTQLELRYVDQIRTIDRIYLESRGKHFAIQSYTIPYWSQEAWYYLFWSYGDKKYGKSPIAQQDARKLFVIVQDDPRNTLYQANWLKNTVGTWGSTEKTFRYGILTTRELKLK